MIWSIFPTLILSVSALGPLLEYESGQMTEAIFTDILMNGRVAVIRGGSVDWPLAQFTCEDYRKQPELREYEIERVYGKNDGSYVSLCHEDPSRDCQNWENDKRPSLNTEPDGPQFAPLYWEVRKHAKAIEYIDKLTPAWGFLNQKNFKWKKNAVELWFSPPSAGAKSHIDAHLQMTVVSQLVGTRRWRLAKLPSAEIPTLIPNHLDSNKFPWDPEIVTVLNTGDVLVFPPGTYHDTLNLSPTRCAASITHQLGYPLPVKFFRKNISPFLSLPDLREVWALLVEFSSFGYLRPRLTITAPFFETHPHVGGYDEDNSLDFFRNIYEKYVENGGLVGMFGEHAYAEYIAFHDVDGDGIVSESEFMGTALEWHKAEIAIMKSIPKKFRLVRYFYQDVEEAASGRFWDELTEWDSARRYQSPAQDVFTDDEL